MYTLIKKAEVPVELLKHYISILNSAGFGTSVLERYLPKPVTNEELISDIEEYTNYQGYGVNQLDTWEEIKKRLRESEK